MPVFRVPVVWSMGSIVDITADDLGMAVELAEQISIPSDGEYQEESFWVDSEYANELEHQRLEALEPDLPILFNVGDRVIILPSLRFVIFPTNSIGVVVGVSSRNEQYCVEVDGRTTWFRPTEIRLVNFDVGL